MVKVYHYLEAKSLRVFFAPSPEGQVFISGKNQREVFYQIFGWEAEYAALFATKDYVCKRVPMKEAGTECRRSWIVGSVPPQSPTDHRTSEAKEDG